VDTKYACVSIFTLTHLGNEGRELQPPNEAVAVGVAHILVRDDHVVLGGHVIRNVMVHDEAQQSLKARK